MKRLSESMWVDAHKKNIGIEDRKENVIKRELDPIWWKNIKLDDVPKYPKEELKALDMIYDIILIPLEKLTGDKNIDSITIAFSDENWWIEINHSTAYNNNTYYMSIHGKSSPYSIKFSEFDLQEKRAIKYRLLNKKLYVYNYKNIPHQYHICDESNRDGETGKRLK